MQRQDNLTFGANLSSFEGLSEKLFQRFMEKQLKISEFDIDNPVLSKVADSFKKIIKPIDAKAVNERIYYHGSILKRREMVKAEGFNTYYSRAVEVGGGRELGIGIYLTPDRKVAQWYGLPIKVRVSLENAGVIKNLEKYKEIIDKNMLPQIDKFILHDMQISEQKKERGILIETYISKLIKRTGYEGIITYNSIDKIAITEIGRAQPQLAVFNPAKITMQKKGLVESTGDLLHYSFVRPFRKLKVFLNS